MSGSRLCRRVPYPEAVTADSLITGARVQTWGQTRPRRQQDAVHLGAVTFKHAHALTSLPETIHIYKRNRREC